MGLHGLRREYEKRCRKKKYGDGRKYGPHQWGPHGSIKMTLKEALTKSIEMENKMPKEPKAPAKAVRVVFTKPADLELYQTIADYAAESERDLGHYILIQLRSYFQQKASQAPARS